MNIKQYIQRENNNLDLARVILASMVIIGHLYELTEPVGQEDLIRMLTGYTTSANLAVKIFFFISGLLVTNSLLTKQSVVNFTISRVFRLVPGLLFVLLISTFIIGPLTTAFSGGEYFSSQATYKYLLDNILYRDNYNLPGVFTDNYYRFAVNGSLWSLSYEVGCYAFLLGAFCLIRTNKLLANLFLIFIIADVFFKFNLLFGWLDAVNHLDTGLLRLSFAAGALLAVNSGDIKPDWGIVAGLFVIAIVFRRAPMNEALFVMACCLLVIVLSGTQTAKNIVIKHDISYGIYLWGFVVQQTLYHFLGPINVYLFMLYSLYISSLMGFISYLLVEKRFMRYGKLLEEIWIKRRAPVKEAVATV